MTQSKTYDGITYTPGARFRVARDGLKLLGWTASRPNVWDAWTQHLSVGDILTCAGWGPDLGSDPGTGLMFTSDASVAANAGWCEITPSAGGMSDFHPEPGALEPVDEDTGGES